MPMMPALPVPAQDAWPTFAVAPSDAQALDTRTGTGVVLGTTRSGKTMRVQLLDAKPFSVAVVSHGWACALLALRAAALGATVTIHSDRPAPWEQLVRATAGSVPFASIVPADAPAPVASLAVPTLVLHDGSGSSVDTAVARNPWQTSVHLLHRITPQTSALLDSCDLVLVPQPEPAYLDRMLEALRLPAAVGDQVQRMTDAEFLAITRTTATFVTIQATPTERRVLGTG